VTALLEYLNLSAEKWSRQSWPSWKVIWPKPDQPDHLLPSWPTQSVYIVQHNSDQHWRYMCCSLRITFWNLFSWKCDLLTPYSTSQAVCTFNYHSCPFWSLYFTHSTNPHLYPFFRSYDDIATLAKNVWIYWKFLQQLQALKITWHQSLLKAINIDENSICIAARAGELLYNIKIHYSANLFLQ